MTLNRQQIIILACILLVGFFIRWGAFSFVVGPPIQNYPTMDEMNFRELARNILEHRTFATWTEGFYTTSTRAPVYPLTIASAYYLAGNKGYAVPKILNLVFDMFNILLVFVLAGSLFRKKMGFIAAGFYAVFGHAPYFMVISSPHTLGLMLLLLVCIALVNLQQMFWLSSIALGIYYSLLIHTRPVFLVALPFLFIAVWVQLSTNKLAEEKPSNLQKNKKFLWWLKINWRKNLLKSLIPLSLVLLLCIPWGLRNYRKHKTIVPVCIIAGWHIASNENRDFKLSIKYLTDQLYAPKRKGFTEGQYFQAAKDKMFKSFWSNPFSFVGFGIGRIFYNWSPPGPFYRFLLPQAYIVPIKIFNAYLLPLPDFEGLLYLFIFSSLVLLFLTGGKVFAGWLQILYRVRGMLIIIIGYSFVHIIGIPLIAYRFLIEPLLIIILLAIAGLYIQLLLEKFPEFAAKSKSYLRDIANWAALQPEASKPKSLVLSIITLYAIMLAMLIFMLLPLLYKPSPTERTYFALLQPNGSLNYNQLREMQWNDLGYIAPKTRVRVQGVVRYIHPGFKYIKNDYYAVKDFGSTAARLYVQYGDSKNIFGIGDVRLNFMSSEIPSEGSVITASGIAKNGPFKEIIIDVIKFQEQ